MKKVLSLVLALSMALSMFTFSFAGLSDVTGTKYAGAVDALVELGVVNGYTDGTFQPNKIVTRAEMAKMLVIALGQQKAADLAKGSTAFSDVAADHWATGYINVAAQSGVIKGYPNGTFAPEATVSYAEAVTMAVRALGYGRVVEIAGTWPTNYMTKAVELGLLDDMSNPAGADGALRGNVAILLWNTLTAHMWVIESENAKDGVTYAEGDIMLNVKFPDYQYLEEAVVTNVAVNDDGEVMVTLDPDEEDEANITAELVKGDFLKLLGQEVSALYDEDEEEFLSISATGATKTVAGVIEYLDDYAPATAADEITINDKDYDLTDAKRALEYGTGAAYAIMAMDGSDVEYVTFLGNNTSIVVEKTKEITDGVRLYAETGSNMDADENALVIKGAERLTVEDIEAGDVVTKLSDSLYAVATAKVDGTFTDFEAEARDDAAAFDYTMTVDGEDYPVASGARFFEDDEDDVQFIGIDMEDLEDEEVTLTLNYLGVVVKVESGKLTASGNGDFYVVTSKGAWDVADSDGTVEYIKLMGANGEEETYAIAEDATSVDDVKDKGTAVYVEFEDGEVDVLDLVTTNNETFAKDNEFTAKVIDSVSEVKDSYVYADETTKYKVNSSTVVYTTVTEEDEDGNDDFVRVDVTEGIDALDDAEAQTVTLVVDSTFGTVKFAYIGDAGTSGLTFGKVERVFTRNGDKFVELINAEGDSVEVEYDDENLVIDTVLAYKVASDKLALKRVLSTGSARLYDQAKLVTDVDGSELRLLTEDGADLDTAPDVEILDFEDEDYEDYKVVLVYMNELDVPGTYEIDDIAELDIAEATADEDDRIYVDTTFEYFAIFRGVSTGDTLTNYTLTYTLAGGTAGAPANRTTYTVATADFTLSNPTRTGYTFTGWTGTGLTVPTMNVTVAQGSVGNRTYTATWDSDDYTIGYTLAGGTEGAPANPTTYTIASADFTLTNPTRTGYTFAGWTGTGLTVPTMSVTVAQGSTGDRAYTATWTVDDYTIGYTLNGGTVADANPTGYTVATTTFTLNNPTREGYNFVGWTGTDLTEPTMSVTIAQGTTGDRSYTANWQTVPYTISYNLDGGTEGTNPTAYTIATADITLTAPTKAGSTFTGWTGTGLGGATMVVTIPLGSMGDRAYTATWTTP